MEIPKFKWYCNISPCLKFNYVVIKLNLEI